jgi:single-stranded-DNA-specific exonuclease
MGPFGLANPKPVFRTSAVDLVAAPRTLKDRHLSLLLKQAGRTFRAMAWRAAERSDYLTSNRYGLDLAYSLAESEYRGERVTELTVADIRVPA